MNRLEPGTTRSESDDLLRMTLLLAIWECHSHLTWGSRNREPVSSAEHSKPLRYVPLTPPQLRKMTRTAASLAGLDEGGPRRGQFELVVETQTVTIDVEITGDPHDRVVILSWSDALPARDAAGRALRRVLELPPAPICYPVDEEEFSPGDPTKSRTGHKLLFAWNVLVGLIIFTVGLPLLPIAILADKYHWFEGTEARERRLTVEAGTAAIKAVEDSAPKGIERSDWGSAVGLTLLAYLESEGEADIEILGRINQEFAAAMQRPSSPELLTEFWDKLEHVGPRGRAFVTRNRFKLLEHLGGPIKLSLG